MEAATTWQTSFATVAGTAGSRAMTAGDSGWLGYQDFGSARRLTW